MYSVYIFIAVLLYTNLLYQGNRHKELYTTPLICYRLATTVLIMTVFHFYRSLGITNCAVSDSCNSCDELRGENILTDTQVKKCSDDSQGVRAIASGIRTAIIECHNQFKDRKWTCSALTSEGSENLFGSFVSESELSDDLKIMIGTKVGSPFVKEFRNSLSWLIG